MNHAIRFTLSGGIADANKITGYEYIISDQKPSMEDAGWSTINQEATHTHIVNQEQDHVTYWFRVTPNSVGALVSGPMEICIDTRKPEIPTIVMEEKPQTFMERFLNTISFDAWFQKEVLVSFITSDSGSGVKDIRYEERKADGTTQQYTIAADTVLEYKQDTALYLKAQAIDHAGNQSNFSLESELAIDGTPPVINGVKDQSVYKQYYIPRFVEVSDTGSGVKTASYHKDGGANIALEGTTKIVGTGTYTVMAEDIAGNQSTVIFKIVDFPSFDKIDGTDESKDIIDQIQNELDEVRGKLEPNEIKDYEKWIDDATDQWINARKKVIEDDDTTSKVEGQGSTSFDPKTELVVEEITEDEIPPLPKKALNVYDVYLKKGNTIIQPDGSIKVYLPYLAHEDPIVYQIDDNGSVKQLSVVKEEGYVTFTTDTLMKYAISDTSQKDLNPDQAGNEQCVVGPDSMIDTNDDVCGAGNEAGDPPVKRPDGSVDVPGGGSVIFPDGNEVELPDGGTIHPDGSVTLPNGTELDPERNKKPTKPDKNEPVCTAGPDGKLGSEDDVCGAGNNQGEEPSKKPNGNVEVPGGGSIIFPGGNEVELPDGGTIHPDGSVTLPDGTELSPEGDLIDKPDEPDSPAEDPDGETITKPDRECKLNDKKINIDTDADGLPDLNLDADGDCVAELNIDMDNDGIPDLEIDTNGDGKADINIDSDIDGIADLNLKKLTAWQPDLNADFHGFAYDTMSGLKPDVNVDTDGDGKADVNIDTDGDGIADSNLQGTDVQGNYEMNGADSVNTGDHTKWLIWIILVLLTTITMIGSILHKRKRQ